MPGGKKRIINSTVLHLRAIQSVTDRVIIGRGLEALLRILEREIRGDSRERDWFTVSLGQLVGGAKIILAGFMFRDAEPGITKPVGMLFDGSRNFLRVTAFGPKGEERQFFCFTERL